MCGTRLLPFCSNAARDFELPGRSEAFGMRVMAATSHPLATLTALDVLRRGGNAMDAAVAAIALLGVVEAPQTGIGGDCFVLYMPRGEGEIIALNGSGWAPAAASLDRCLARGMKSIPSESADAVTVPGAVASWARLIADHGTMKLADLLQPAIAAAEDGYPVTERVARDWARQLEKLRKNRAAASVFLPNGATPRPGDIHRQPALAAALKSIASDGPAAFYEGWIARDMVDALRAAGGCHTLEDFAAYAPEYVTPIGTTYRGYEVWQCPPNGQGLVPLIMLKALEGFDPFRWAPLSVERCHVLIEIARQAYADRDSFICDPRTGGNPVKMLLSDEHATKLRANVSMKRRMEGLAAFPIPDHRDTAFLAVVDSDRNTVAFINSIFDDFGSGIVSPAAGVIFHNRGFGFVLERRHPNAIAGRKRPLNTIIPAIVTQKGKAVMPFGVTGGQFQPFGQVEVLTNVIDYAMGIQAAIDAPRIFGLGDTVQVESSVPSSVVSGLAALGHHVVHAENPLGTAQAIWIDWEGGLLRGGADGRRDGLAAGW
jgi:gamma-glutamyltranspeptidase/glutathione hydrolase